MADLNKLMIDIQNESIDIEKKLKGLLIKYDSLYRDGNQQFIEERISSNGSMDGLEDFRRLILIIKRNKDVISSLVRGIDNLRSIKEFKFIEEEISKPIKKRKKSSFKTKPAKFKSIISDESVLSDVIESENLLKE